MHEDRKHFEFLVLEAAQAGLSWATLLRKREGYRAAYRGFDPRAVARFNQASVARLVVNDHLVSCFRHGP